VASTGAGAEESSAVEVLTDDNFDKLVKPSEAIWMVEFYAPWCGHCKKLQPIWAETASLATGVVRFGKVDTDAESKLSTRFNIEGLPTIIRFDGKRQDVYNGPRQANELLEFAETGTVPVDPRKKKANNKANDGADKGKAGATAAVVDDRSVHLNDATFDQKVQDGETWLLLFTAEWCSHCQDMKAAWGELSRVHDLGARVGRIDTDESMGLVGRYNVSSLPTILLIGASSTVYKHAGYRTVPSFTLFLASGGKSDGEVHGSKPKREPLPGAYNHDLLETINDGNVRSLLSSGVWVVAVVRATNCPRCWDAVARLETIAATLKPQGVRFGVFTTPDSLFLAAAWAVTEYPTLFLVRDGSSRWTITW
jgi:protein disulfide-isomerase-like protein